MKKIKSIAKLVEEVATLLQRLVRIKAAVHADSDGYVKCCSCHKFYHWKDMDGGHYLSRKYTATKIRIENIHPQCKGCNGWGDASVGHEYYLYMVEMYGENAVRQLTAEKHKTKKHNRTELEELKIHYKKLIADLEKEL
tara:strand:- start:1223 stop:1639 length:417 start_codon:yes stop_codon:yes gene_type:complete